MEEEINKKFTYIIERLAELRRPPPLNPTNLAMSHASSSSAVYNANPQFRPLPEPPDFPFRYSPSPPPHLNQYHPENPNFYGHSNQNLNHHQFYNSYSPSLTLPGSPQQWVSPYFAYLPNQSPFISDFPPPHAARPPISPPYRQANQQWENQNWSYQQGYTTQVNSNGEDPALKAREWAAANTYRQLQSAPNLSTEQVYQQPFSVLTTTQPDAYPNYSMGNENFYGGKEESGNATQHEGVFIDEFHVEEEKNLNVSLEFAEQKYNHRELETRKEEELHAIIPKLEESVVLLLEELEKEVLDTQDANENHRREKESRVAAIEEDNMRKEEEAKRVTETSQLHKRAKDEAVIEKRTFAEVIVIDVFSKLNDKNDTSRNPSLPIPISKTQTLFGGSQTVIHIGDGRSLSSKSDVGSHAPEDLIGAHSNLHSSSSISVVKNLEVAIENEEYWLMKWKFKLWREFLYVVDWMIDEYGLKPDTHFYNRMLNLRVDGNNLKLVEITHAEMSVWGVKPDVSTFNVLIKALCKAYQLRPAILMMEDMLSYGLVPDKRTFTTIMQGFIEEGDLDGALKIREQMVEFGCSWSNVSVNVIVHGFCKEGKVEDALNFIQEMTNQGEFFPDQYTFNTLVNGLCKAGHVKHAMEIMDVMLQEGYDPDVYTYNSVISGLCKLGEVKEAVEILDQMITRNCSPNTVTYNTLISTLCKENQSEEATELARVFTSKGILPDVCTFNSLIQGLFPIGVSEEDAQKLVEIANEINESLDDARLEDVNSKLLRYLVFGFRAVLSPMAATFGGIVCQEVVKACSGMLHPLFLLFYFDSVESLPKEPLDASEFRSQSSLHDAQISVFGYTLEKKLKDARVFVVGANALGCKSLKNLALIGVSCGSQGKLTVTYDDVIEKSNLSCQSLFRNWDIRQAKFTITTTTAAGINFHLKIGALQNRIGPETKQLDSMKIFMESSTLKVDRSVAKDVELMIALSMEFERFHSPRPPEFATSMILEDK